MEAGRCSHPLILQSIFQWCIHTLKNNRVPFFSSLFTGILCYGYAISNKLVNHDEVQCLFAKGGTVASGLWGLGALDLIFPNYSMPWANGLLALLLMAAAVCIMVRILSIGNPVLQALFAGSVIAFPSLIGTFAYMFTIHAFALSFLLAVLAVWFVCRDKYLYLVPALGCMVLSLSIYQSYISVAAGLLVLVLIRQLLEGEPVSTVIRRGIVSVAFLAVSLGVYYAATQAILILKDITMNDYAGGNVSFSFSGIPAAVVTAYRAFFRFFTEGYRGLIPTAFSRNLHWTLLLLTLVLLILPLRSGKKKEIGSICLLAALVLILPLAICCMYLFTTEDSVHTLVLYGFVCVYALTAIAADLSLEAVFSCRFVQVTGCIAQNLVSIVLSLILACNLFLANEIWLNLQLRYENAFAFYSCVLSELHALPDFTDKMPVALIGSQQEPEFYETEFPFTGPMTGTKGFKPDSYSREKFFTYYVGVELPFLSDEQCAVLSSDPQISSMPCWPYYGSIRIIDGTVIVKLS